jgi:hypothetical protein
MDKILPPAVMNGRNMATAVKYGQNFVSSGKNGLIILKNVAEGALQGKMHQGPRTLKPPLNTHFTSIFGYFVVAQY